MQGFWGTLAAQLGKRAGLVSIVGLLITVTLGFGITKLEFATGQDSYLNKSDQVYKDNVAYEKLFGGQAMLTLITMDKGHTVNELFLPGNRKNIDGVMTKLRAGHRLLGVVGPSTALQFSDDLVQGETGDPTTSVAGKTLLGAIARDTDPASKKLRQGDSAVTLKRLLAVPDNQRSIANPKWVDFLLHNNDGSVRKALRSFFPDDRHAQIVTRLVGNEGIDEEGANSDFVVATTKALSVDHGSVVTTGAPVSTTT